MAVASLLTAAEPWEQRRSAISHDWLKLYLRDLGKWQNVLAREVDDPEFVERFTNGGLQQWESRRLDVLRLAADYPRLMSPAVYFDRLPLSQCADATRAWLLPLVHALWAHRVRASGRVDDLVAAVDCVDRAYRVLLDAAGYQSVELGTGQAELVSGLIREFSDACTVLSVALQMLRRSG